MCVIAQDGVHVSDMDDSKLSGSMDPSGKYVISTRIRVGRNIRGFGLSPGIKRADRAAVEKLVCVDSETVVRSDGVMWLDGMFLLSCRLCRR